jgi:RNA ligase
MEYHKIETLFERDGKFVVTEELRSPVYGAFKKWHVTEKIDGTNIRVTLTEDGKVVPGGRTDAAQIPADLIQYLYETFPADKMRTALWLPDENGKPQPVKAVLYGEGYGAGIQKGGGLDRKDKAFRLFDVLVADKWWLDWANVEDVAGKLGIKTALYLGDFSLEEIVSMVKAGVPSVVSVEDSGQERMAEGVIGRTIEPLFDRRGRRIILKLKTSDFGKQAA